MLKLIIYLWYLLLVSNDVYIEYGQYIHTNKYLPFILYPQYLPRLSTTYVLAVQYILLEIQHHY